MHKLHPSGAHTAIPNPQLLGVNHATNLLQPDDYICNSLAFLCRLAHNGLSQQELDVGIKLASGQAP
jgi:hypothetical protein